MKITLTTLGVVTLATLATPAAAQMAYPDKCKGAATTMATGHDMPTEGMTDYQKASMDG